MKDLNRHYLLVFPFVVGFLLISLLAPIKLIWGIFLILGFLWPWVLLTPELREKVRSPKYRYSFFRLTYWLEEQIAGQLFFESKINLNFISRTFGPLFFSFILSMIAGFDLFLSCLVGVILGEAWLYFNRAHYPKAYENKEPSLSENSL